MPTAIHQKIRLAEQGEYPQAILRLPSGWVMAGEVQPLKGYCILMRNPVARDLNVLSESERAQYGQDMAHVGDALLAVLGAYRINYETWGNLDPALHTHIVPRYLHEPDGLRILPPRQAYDWNQGRKFDPAIDSLWVSKVRAFLQKYK